MTKVVARTTRSATMSQIYRCRLCQRPIGPGVTHTDATVELQEDDGTLRRIYEEYFCDNCVPYEEQPTPEPEVEAEFKPEPLLGNSREVVRRFIAWAKFGNRVNALRTESAGVLNYYLDEFFAKHPPIDLTEILTRHAYGVWGAACNCGWVPDWKMDQAKPIINDEVITAQWVAHITAAIGEQLPQDPATITVSDFVEGIPTVLAQLKYWERLPLTRLDAIKRSRDAIDGVIRTIESAVSSYRPGGEDK